MSDDMIENLLAANGAVWAANLRDVAEERDKYVRLVAVLQAEVRAWRLWYDYPGDSTGMIMELWTNVDKARANTDAQGALT